MNLKTLGERIQLARDERRMSQEQLASAIGCSQSALSNYEKGKRRIYLSQLEKLSEALEKPIDYFLETSAEKQESSRANPKDNRFLKIINDVYQLNEEEVDEVDCFIQYLKWRRTKGEEGHGFILK